MIINNGAEILNHIINFQRMLKVFLIITFFVHKGVEGILCKNLGEPVVKELEGSQWGLQKLENGITTFRAGKNEHISIQFDKETSISDTSCPINNLTRSV